MILIAALALQTNHFVAAAPFPALPYVTVDERYAGDMVADGVCRKYGLQGRVLWIDGSANLSALSSDHRIRALVAKIKDVGFNTVVYDVKPIVGRTVYPSALTRQMTRWKDQTMPEGYDPVKAMRAETLAAGLSFFVSLNAFCEGHQYAKRDEGKADSQFGDAGWGYRHPELQSVVYSATPAEELRSGLRGSNATFAPTSEGQDQIPLMMNPHHPEVQARVLAFVKEVASRYRPDGLLFDDRYRFHGLDADFSDYTRAKFERKIGRRLVWPDDVYQTTFSGETKGMKPGAFFDDWLAWRADELASFTLRVRQTLKEASPATRFGIYAGSWYGDYAKYGSNYASDALAAGFPFLTRKYRQAGFAKNLDVLITGCYYRVPTMFRALEQGQPIGRTVEAAGVVSSRVARDQCWVYAGIQLADFKGDEDLVARSLQAAAATTQGIMVFDLSHGIDAYWPLFKRAFKHPAAAPHSVNGLIQDVRARRERRDAEKRYDKPFPMFEGAPGAGF
ncbi:MAG: family 10 glycosylhydrolase [Armatimonadetes bacterium]|nr:family 10 glycosylhydrolase [Armatimonadota bacterium]